MNEDCPFCSIVAGEREANLCYQDEQTIAFLDENPATDGHTLVIPTDHREDLLTADQTGEAVFEAVTRVGGALDDVLEPDGFSVFHTTGPLVGRVTHAHVHVVPRYEADGVGFGLPRDRLGRSEGERLAARIASSV